MRTGRYRFVRPWLSTAAPAVLALAFALAVPAGACAAQETGSPVYQAPYRAFARSEIGISLHLRYRGQQEEYLRAKVSVNGYNTGGTDPWYYILPNGSLYEFTPSYANPALDGALVVQLGPAVYNDPSLLWNAQNTAVPATLTF